MPMCDAYIPAGALSPEAERELVAKLTDLLLIHEGGRPSNERSRVLTWVFVHRVEAYAAGQPTSAPHYKFVCSVPEGQYNEERRAAVTAEITQAVAEVERGEWADPVQRVWVFTHEVRDGEWGIRGRTLHLPDLYAHVISQKAREFGEQVLVDRRRQEAEAILAAAGAGAPAGADG
jgi:phenylpyruvate tautomerase PptA (4-oxalocrotonate tautomerase family)